jgi:hypothetical protein
MSSDSNTEFLKQVASSYVASTFEKVNVYLKILREKPEATENRKQRLNIFLALLDFIVSLPFEIDGFKLFLIESLPELKESYSIYPIELKVLTEKVIAQIEKITEG